MLVIVLATALTGFFGVGGLKAQDARTTYSPAFQSGSVDGTLFPPMESHGKSVANITVTISETGQTATTDKNGHYAFTSVKPGTYTLVATAEGYSRLRIEDVVVSPNHSVTLSPQTMPMVMKDGEVQTMEEVVVHARKDIETMTPYVVTDQKPEPFSDRNVDLPRGIDDVQPYYIFNSQQLEESGTTDVEDFLKQRLTMDTTVMTGSQTTIYSRVPAGQSNVFPNAASSINLNGLGANHTLVLVNGLQVAGVSVYTNSGAAAQPGQTDVNGIPMAAIDRIEVLPSSAGAIYGAGAEGGVINIVLKKAYAGGDITATYASTWDGHGPSRTMEATFGKSLEQGKTQLFVTAQYSDQSPMSVRDRVNLLNRGYATLLQNSPSSLGIGISNTTTNTYFPPVGATPNVAASPTYTAVPSGYVIPSNAPAGSTLITTRPVGTYFNGAAVTAATPWVLVTPVQPLTLKGTGAALGGSNPYIATFPVGYGPGSNPSSIIGGVWNLSPGAVNEAPDGLLVPLGNYPRRKSLMATISRQMTSNVLIHVDLSKNENHSFSNYNPIATQNGTVVPAEVPENPFNQAVRISFPVNYSAPAISDTRTSSITLGGTVKLPFDWVAHLDYQWSETSFESRYKTLITNPLNFSNAPTFYGNNTLYSYLGVPDNNLTPLWSGAINPFTDTVANPINYDPYAENVYNSGKTTSNDLVLAASGPLVHLPWGTPRLSVRAEHNKSGQPEGSTNSFAPIQPFLGLPGGEHYAYTSFGQTQSTDSANAELDLPIFKSKVPLLRSVDAQLNISSETSTVWTGSSGIFAYAPYAYNQYPFGALFISPPNTLSRTASEPLQPYTNQSGTVVAGTTAQPYRTKAVSTNNSVTGPALSYKPIEDLVLRASIASGFVPATYAQLIPAYAPSSASPTITDPKTGTQYSITTFSLGGNPNLKPQTSKSWDFGAIWEPSFRLLHGLRLDVEFTETKQFNLITDPGVQGFINLESLFPNNVIRGSNGQIATVYDEFINVAEAKQRSWNLTADYRFTTGVGAFELTGAESIQEQIAQQLVAGTQFLEYVGYPNSGGVAKTKATGTLRWSWHNWVASWTTVYFDGYKQYGAPGDPGAYSTALETGGTYSLNTQYLLPQGGFTVPSQVYHNLYVSYTFRKGTIDPNSRLGRWTNAFLDGTRVSLAINDVFNTVPPFDAYYSPFYTSPYGDIQLRSYQLSIRKSF